MQDINVLWSFSLEILSSRFGEDSFVLPVSRGLPPSCFNFSLPLCGVASFLLGLLFVSSLLFFGFAHLLVVFEFVLHPINSAPFLSSDLQRSWDIPGT